MHRARLNRALSKEIKYYGLSYLGLVGGVIGGVSAWLLLGMTIGILSGAVSYGFSAIIAKSWHSGAMQRYIYWHLPLKGMFGGKYLPPSHARCFF